MDRITLYTIHMNQLEVVCETMLYLYPFYIYLSICLFIDLLYVIISPLHNIATTVYRIDQHDEIVPFYLSYSSSRRRRRGEETIGRR